MGGSTEVLLPQATPSKAAYHGLTLRFGALCEQLPHEDVDCWRLPCTGKSTPPYLRDVRRLRPCDESSAERRRVSINEGAKNRPQYTMILMNDYRDSQNRGS